MPGGFGRVRRALPASAVIAACLVVPRSLAAQEEPEGEAKNELALVLAGTHEHDEDKSFFTVGGEYERRLGRRLGLGLTAEYVTEVDAFVLVVPVVFRPTPDLKFFAGPGFENKPEEAGEREPPAGEEHDRKTSFLFRLGTGYAIEFGGHYAITPTLELDFVGEDGGRARAFVYGASFSAGF